MSNFTAHISQCLPWQWQPCEATKSEASSSSSMGLECINFFVIKEICKYSFYGKRNHDSCLFSYIRPELVYAKLKEKVRFLYWRVIFLSFSQPHLTWLDQKERNKLIEIQLANWMPQHQYFTVKSEIVFKLCIIVWVLILPISKTFKNIL